MFESWLSFAAIAVVAIIGYSFTKEDLSYQAELRLIQLRSELIGLPCRPSSILDSTIGSLCLVLVWQFITASSFVGHHHLDRPSHHSSTFVQCYHSWIYLSIIEMITLRHQPLGPNSMHWPAHSSYLATTNELPIRAITKALEPIG